MDFNQFKNLIDSGILSEEKYNNLIKYFKNFKSDSDSINEEDILKAKRDGVITHEDFVIIICNITKLNNKGAKQTLESNNSDLIKIITILAFIAGIIMVLFNTSGFKEVILPCIMGGYGAGCNIVHNYINTFVFVLVLFAVFVAVKNMKLSAGDIKSLFNHLKAKRDKLPSKTLILISYAAILISPICFLILVRLLLFISVEIMPIGGGGWAVYFIIFPIILIISLLICAVFFVTITVFCLKDKEELCAFSILFNVLYFILFIALYLKISSS